jgi:hypothetical protein
MVRLHRKLGWSVGLGMLAAVAAGCGAAGDANDVRDNLGQIESILDATSLLLPPIPIDIGRDGRVERIADMPAKTVDAWAERATGNPVVGRVVVLDEAHLKWFDRANIQHMTLAVRPEGLYFLVNGRPMPHVAWDDQSLDNLVQVAGKFQKNPDEPEMLGLVSPKVFESIEAAAPLLKSLNVTFNVRFPDFPDIGPANRQPIPLPVEARFNAAAAPKIAVAATALPGARSSGRGTRAAPAATPTARADAGIDAGPAADPDGEAAIPLQTVDVEVVYKPLAPGQSDLGWVPSIFGFSTVDLQKIADSVATIGKSRTKIPQMRLREDLRRRIEAEGISSVGVEARTDGLFATVHGQLLPHLAWDEESLTNLAAVLEQLYPSGLKKLPDDARWVPVVRSTAPMYNDYGIAVLVRFPVESEGQAPTTTP